MEKRIRLLAMLAMVASAAWGHTAYAQAVTTRSDSARVVSAKPASPMGTQGTPGKPVAFNMAATLNAKRAASNRTVEPVVTTPRTIGLAPQDSALLRQLMITDSVRAQRPAKRRNRD